MSSGEKQELSGRVVFVPAHLVVYQYFEAVEGISDEEAEEAALLAFEEESPFPPEQIATGRIVSSDGAVAVWGCEENSLPEAGSDQFLLPEFFPLLSFSRDAGACEICETANGSFVLIFDQAGSLPTEIIGFSNRTADSSFWDDVEGAFRFLGRRWPGKDGFKRLGIREVSADSRGKFRSVTEIGDEDQFEWSLQGQSLWKADLRASELIQEFISQKKAGERLWLGAKVAAAILLLVFLSQGVLFALNFWVAGKERKESAQGPDVRAVEERANLVSRLGDLGESRVSVFERLGQLNLLRPNGVQFLSVEFEEPDQFTVEGRVTQVGVLNEYMDRLTADPRFLLVELPRPRSRDGRVEFELEVRVPNREIGL